MTQFVKFFAAGNPRNDWVSIFQRFRTSDAYVEIIRES